jgi:TPR repeat protein
MDAHESARWYRQAASQGVLFAQTRLGKMYLTGSGVVKDENEARKWLRIAAEAGDIEAMELLKGIGSADARTQPTDNEIAACFFHLRRNNGSVERDWA